MLDVDLVDANIRLISDVVLFQYVLHNRPVTPLEAYLMVCESIGLGPYSEEIMTQIIIVLYEMGFEFIPFEEVVS